MMYQMKLHLKRFLFWGSIILLVVVLYFQIHTEYTKHYFTQAPIYYHLYYSFSLNISPMIILLVAGIPMINLFVESYHSGFYILELSRVGRLRYSFRQLIQVSSLTYIYGFISCSFFIGLLALKAPFVLTDRLFNAGDVMANQWLLETGHVSLFYLLIISLLSLWMVVYVLGGFVLSVLYPNKSITFLLPTLTWYFSYLLGFWTVRFPLLAFLSFDNVFSITNSLEEILNYFGFYHPMFILIFPYIYFLVTFMIYVFLMTFIVQRQWHFFDKE